MGRRQPRRPLEPLPRDHRLAAGAARPRPVAGAPARLRGAEGRLRDRLRARSPPFVGADPTSIPAPRRRPVTANDPGASELEVAVEQMLAGRLHAPHELLGPRTTGDTM